MNANPQVSQPVDKACYPEPNGVTESVGRLRATSPVEGSPLSPLALPRLLVVWDELSEVVR